MEKRPYRPSWVDRFFDWIDQLPIHPAPFYLTLYLIAALLTHVAYWIAVPDSVGHFVPRMATDSAWILAPGYIHYLRNFARREIKGFKQHIAASEVEHTELEYRFTNMPAWIVLIGSLVTFALVFYGTFDDALYYFNQPEAPLLSKVLVGLVGAVSYMTLPVLFIFSLRLLLLVRDTFRRYARINIFHLEPLYGLTTITVNVGIMVIVFMSANLLAELAVENGTMRFETVVSFTVAMALISLASFILPLLGIHDRIQVEKQKAVGETGEQIEALQGELYSLVRAGEYEQLSGVEHGMNALFAMRERLEKVPTWPWRPGTPRNFASAVLLPLLIWGVQQLVGKFF